MVVAWMIYRGVQQLHFVYQPPCVFTLLHAFTSQSIAICFSLLDEIVASFKYSCIASSLSRIFLLHCIIIHNDRHQSGRRLFQEDVP